MVSAVRLLCCLLLLFAQCPASACLWDRDTLASEAAGIPEVIRVITGRFERNPTLYYAMRLERVTAELTLKPEALELYDDAAVACDRLGRSDDALGWMEKKRRRLEGMGRKDAGVGDHWYRYYANAGTFYAHRWIRSGADRKRMADLTQARDMIAKAIEINPDAHFGREKYQLKAITWLISPPKFTADDDRLPNFLTESYRVTDAPEAVQGLTGLIVLGNAWESVDTFHALARAIQSDGERSSPARMARLRACELIDAGRKSLVPNAPTGEKLKALVLGSRTNLYQDQIKEIEETFARLRGEADRWQEQRTAYMMARLEAGRHPDTDADFWRDYRESRPPVIRETLAGVVRRYTLPVVIAVLSGGCALALIVARFLFRRWSSKRAIPYPSGDGSV